MKLFFIIIYLVLILQNIVTARKIGRAPEIHWKLGNEGGIWSPNCDFPGNDLGAIHSQNIECGKVCLKNKECTHYMWNSLEGGTCWMKEGEVTRVDAVLSIENDVICGIMPFQRPEEETEAPNNDLINPTFEEFKNALTLNNFPVPSKEQYKNFISGAAFHSGFGSKTEMAMFLAQLMHESEGLTKKMEIRCGKSCTATGACLNDYKSSLGFKGKHYCGRGYIQLSWANNYKGCSQFLFKDDRLLRNPDLVALDDAISWGCSFWYWKVNVRTNPEVSKDFKFGVSTKLLNGKLECNGENIDEAKNRYEIYKITLNAFNVEDEPIEEGCY